MTLREVIARLDEFGDDETIFRGVGEARSAGRGRD
jgi:hypothetical protein